MSTRASSLAAWAAAALAAVLIISAFVLEPGVGEDLELQVVAPFVVLGYGGVGALIVTRSTARSIGWLLLVVGLGFATTAASEAYARKGLVLDPGSVPGPEWGSMISQIVLIPFLAAIPLILLLYPSGALPSPRWRPVLWAMIVFPLIGFVGFAITPGPVGGEPQVPNPIGIEGAETLVVVLLTVGGLGSFAAALACVAALVLRFRRSSGERRQQIRWLAYSAAIAAAVLVMVVLSDIALSPREDAPDPVATEVLFTLFIVTLGVGFPVSIGLAILKYRLYDIDLVINKTVVYGLLAAFITAVYVGIVVGVGSLVGQGDDPNLGLSIVATAVVAMAFQPVRERAQHLANRLVYGKRATPYEVLSAFSRRMGESYATEDVLPRLARILAEGTGATHSVVWIRVGRELRPDAAWPANLELPTAIDASARSEEKEGSLFLPVRHQGELLGALSLSKAPGDPLRPTEVHLARDVASQAGLVLRNVRLIEELKASRVRLVKAQDDERRRLERNIHDGAQQQLVALQVKMGLAKGLLHADRDRATALLADLQAEVTTALRDLRDLARGIYPPLLADEGLTKALRAQAGRVPIPVEIEADAIGRYPQEAEAAVYFCVLEALQNVAKYADASNATVRLSTDDGHLSFVVTDNGVGFDPQSTSHGTGLQGMADRLEALGGQLTVTSAVGKGTTVSGRLPASTRTVGEPDDRVGARP